MTVSPKDRLTIQQAIEHQWFKFAAPPSSPTVQKRVPDHLAGAAKRLRTDGGELPQQQMPALGA